MEVNLDCARRLCETYVRVSKLSYASATFFHALDVHWPLCPFELRGSCRDANCAFQMATDFELSADQQAKALLVLLARWGSPLHKSGSRSRARVVQICLRSHGFASAPPSNAPSCLVGSRGVCVRACR